MSFDRDDICFRGGPAGGARGGRHTGGRGPRVLVSVASRHGATREIGAAVARCMVASEAGRALGLSAALEPAQLQPRLAGFDAVVLGSAVYAGRWMDPARLFAESAADELSRLPTWLFSSGLDRAHGGAATRSDDALRISHAIGARGHRAFPGRLEPRVLSASEQDDWGRVAPRDFRNWSDVRAWAEEIVDGLVTQPTADPARNQVHGSMRHGTELVLHAPTG